MIQLNHTFVGIHTNYILKRQGYSLEVQKRVKAFNIRPSFRIINTGTQIHEASEQWKNFTDSWTSAKNSNHRPGFTDYLFSSAAEAVPNRKLALHHNSEMFEKEQPTNRPQIDSNRRQFTIIVGWIKVLFF